MVRRIAGDSVGTTERHKLSYIIAIEKAAIDYFPLASEILIHEWAHAFAWRPHLEGDHAFEIHHDEEWAIAYGKIYRAFFDDGGEHDAGEFSPRPWS